MLFAHSLASGRHELRIVGRIGRVSRTSQGSCWGRSYERRRLSGRHLVAGMRIRQGRHDMARMRVRRTLSWLCRRCVMTAMRVGGLSRRHRLALPHWLWRRRGRGGALRARFGFGFSRGASRCLSGDWLSRRRLRLGRRPRHGHSGHVVSLVLRHCRGGERRRQQHREQALHAASPSIGRTVTTRIIPACMWSSMWQWKAQSPGASAVRSKLSLAPGSTLTVCFTG